jgi:23S rRNA pseudouridine1911/1915/1917 synthase
VVTPEEHGRRLDQVLAARVPDLSRRMARVLLDLGGVFVDDARAKQAGRPVCAGQRIVAHLGGALARATKQVGAAARARDEDALPAYTVVHEDGEVVVVDKPAGLLTAPTPESDRNNLASLLARRPGGQPVFVVHRIDLETSGLLVFAKTAAANRTLSEVFRRHDLVREYLALAAGPVPASVAVVDRPVGGRRAVTHLSVVERFGARATLVRARLETGRTHQIRLHLTALGHPVLGDRKYGAPGQPSPPRLALHATRLAFAHPASGIPLDLACPWPPDLAAFLERLRRAGGG